MKKTIVTLACALIAPLAFAQINSDSRRNRINCVLPTCPSRLW